MAKEKTKKGNVIETIMLIVLVVCIALILFELFSNIPLSALPGAGG